MLSYTLLDRALPVEFHCHGMGDYDFSQIDQIDLSAINKIAVGEGVYCVPCIFLSQSKLDDFVTLLRTFSTLKNKGELSNLLGISLEGPILASLGGTPEQGTWAPTKSEWAKIAGCGEHGLVYSVISPDAALPGSCLKDMMTPSHPDMEWIIRCLQDANVMPAIGHFSRFNPKASAQAIKNLISICSEYSSGEPRVLTDHFFNDMPLLFKHAWRTEEELVCRDEAIRELNLNSWAIENLSAKLGSVPATIIEAAKKNQIVMCINFDGMHVDLSIAEKVLSLVGSKNIIAMTDRIDVPQLGGQLLEQRFDNTLWYQSSGVVAAGSTSIKTQMNKLKELGMIQDVLYDISVCTPLKMLQKHALCSV